MTTTKTAIAVGDTYGATYCLYRDWAPSRSCRGRSVIVMVAKLRNGEMARWHDSDDDRNSKFVCPSVPEAVAV